MHFAQSFLGLSAHVPGCHVEWVFGYIVHGTRARRTEIGTGAPRSRVSYCVQRRVTTILWNIVQRNTGQRGHVSQKRLSLWIICTRVPRKFLLCDFSLISIWRMDFRVYHKCEIEAWTIKIGTALYVSIWDTCTINFALYHTCRNEPCAQLFLCIRHGWRWTRVRPILSC